MSFQLARGIFVPVEAALVWLTNSTLETWPSDETEPLRCFGAHDQYVRRANAVHRRDADFVKIGSQLAEQNFTAAEIQTCCFRVRPRVPNPTTRCSGAACVQGRCRAWTIRFRRAGYHGADFRLLRRACLRASLCGILVAAASTNQFLKRVCVIASSVSVHPPVQLNFVVKCP